MSGTVFDSFLLYMEADMKYKCLIFDLDGTLVDSMWMWEAIDIEFLGASRYECPAYIQISIH